MNLATWLWQTARTTPDAPAIRVDTRVHATYGALAAQACAFGQSLSRDHGIRAGDHVAIFAKNCADYLATLYGVLWIGAVVVPINSKLHASEAAWIIANSEARLVLTETGNCFDLADLPACPELAIGSVGVQVADLPAPAQVAANETAWLFYTSGTTGRPKGAMLSHANLRAMATVYALDVDPVLAEDHVLYAAPMSHGAGLYNFQYVRAGACHVIPESQGFDTAEISRLAETLGSVVFFAAPTMVSRLIRHAEASGYHGRGIRSIIYGGGPMYLADLDHALEVFGPKFIQIYGQGESPMTITALRREIVGDRAHPRAEVRRASVGTAQACVEVRVRDGQLRDLPPDEIGEIFVRGDTVMTGYWRNDPATAAAVLDGWLKTGDLGRMDADGFLTLTDRSKDVVISGGTNIYPREVEEPLMAHPGVREASVIGVPHPDWGEEVVAFIVPVSAGACDAASLDAWCRSRIAGFKRPKRYVFLPDLPKNSYGKVLKTTLRDWPLSDG
ncbi:MAG: class I adenylate-forming enzyme family protein [Pseudooceanicola nanhaiensis]|uniref:class I adenylate-forming enzyme family protein n=1 Tax=Rhodobacterales TaxID=204455 RepID=UPI004059EED4